MDEFNDAEIADNVRRALDDSEVEAGRIQQFQDAVRDLSLPGPIGALLRQVAHAWAEFEQHEQIGGTTAGEEIRLRGVLGEAMATLDWLQEGA